MGRASKFAFPLPGRRAHGDRDNRPEPQPANDYDYHPSSKAERLLGTGLPGHRQGSYSSASGVPRNNSATPSLETKPSYMSIALSEPSQDSAQRKGSSYADDGHLVPPHPRFHQDQSHARSKDRAGSVTSSTYSRHLNSQGSSSTMRSHHDSHRQPSHVSQKPSMSSMRDGGLRKGHPAFSSSQSLGQESLNGSVLSGDFGSAGGGSKKKKVPARLDLSKLFPKAPKSKNTKDQQLLSPTKFVNSPVAMSSTSTHFSRPLTSPTSSTSNRDRAPSLTSIRTSDTLREGRAQAAKERAYKSQFDNAKVNRRRPPPGIQHWFDGISDDEEEEEEVETPHLRASTRPQESRSASQHRPSPHEHRRKESSSGPGRRASHHRPASKQPSYPVDERAYAADRPHRSERGYPIEPPAELQTYRHRADNYQSGMDARIAEKPHVRSQPSQNSFATHNTARTNTSKMSGRDLKGDSVLSLSSSEDEGDPRSSGTSLPIIRDSLAMSTESESEIMIGRAQAFDIRPRQNRPGRRMTSASGNSIQSSGTGATIDVMLSPTTAASSQTNLVLPRHSNSRGRRGSRHSRQVSAIPEDQDNDSKSYTESFSNASFDDKESIRSGRTSKSEPRHLGHKLMAVTEEEEVLLELMRRKRAAMAKQSFTDGYRSAIKAEQHYMSMDSPVSEYSSNQTVNESDWRHSKRSSRSHTTITESEPSSAALETLSNATYVPPSSRNRPPPMANEALLRSPASSSVASTSSAFSPPPRSRATQRIMSQAPQLSPALFSPLEVFPSPPDSPNFPGTASHTDTIPSPVTPGPVSHGELHVKVAGSSIGGSEASFGTDQDSIHNAHHHHPSDFTMGHKGKDRSRKVENLVARNNEETEGTHGIDRSRSHSRRRTASSGANVAPCAEPVAQSAASNNFAVPPRTSSIMAFPKPGISIQQDDGNSVSSAASSRRPGEAEWDWDADVDVGAVISQVRKSRSSHILGSSSRTSVSSTTPSKQRLSRQNSTASHVSPKSGARSDAGKKLSVAPMSNAAIAQRSSVCDDVLAAWSSLGGSRGEFYG
ncbi:proteophosphoglycan ppg1 [Diplodia corticola]|uniref:Proteophosphoglycan ppg1 n=1 Tax=Diplodia corticola TaxID=236234 RepID=A0A1J9RFP8_9PEZI|nr:proteophosphoglycan ppg1 [Diplodia corticola]OJD40358.1 proteophosphoglycan ppg1 [Diplodia corticola]